MNTDHKSDHKSAIEMFQHLHSCEEFKCLFSLINLPGCLNNKADVVRGCLHEKTRTGASCIPG